MPLVLDCSIALAWCFEDESDAYADAILEQLQSDEAIVPAIWPFEIANGLVVGERRQRLVEADSERFLGMLGRLPISVDQGSASDHLDQVIVLARRCGLSAYDAAYAELAMRRGCSSATLDDRLRDAAAVLGIGVI